MRKFLQQCLFFIALLIISRLIFIGFISYTNKAANTDYGLQSKNQVIIVGSSNAQHNFDYNFLNKNDQQHSWRSCYLPEPHGLFLLLQKLKKIVHPNDLLIFDLPYSLYDKEKFAPNKQMFYQRIKPRDYQTFATHFPFLFTKHFGALTIFNTPDFLELKQEGTFHDFNDLQKQDLGETYLACNEPFDPNKHNILSTNFDSTHIDQIGAYIASEFAEQKIRFYYPEINTISSNISAQKVRHLGTFGTFLNLYTNSSWDKKYLHDQWYHLNHCGAIENSKKIIQLLKED